MGSDVGNEPSRGWGCVWRGAARPLGTETRLELAASLPRCQRQPPPGSRFPFQGWGSRDKKLPSTKERASTVWI